MLLWTENDDLSEAKGDMRMLAETQLVTMPWSEPRKTRRRCGRRRKSATAQRPRHRRKWCVRLRYA